MHEKPWKHFNFEYADPVVFSQDGLLIQASFSLFSCRSHDRTASESILASEPAKDKNARIRISSAYLCFSGNLMRERVS